MSTSLPKKFCPCAQVIGSAWRTGGTGTWWSQHREASLNWLALGVFLAAWNTSDSERPPRSRPDSLRGYTQVSVRAATAHGALVRTAPSSG
jgi:hypothetical protein